MPSCRDNLRVKYKFLKKIMFLRRISNFLFFIDLIGVILRPTIYLKLYKVRVCDPLETF